MVLLIYCEFCKEPTRPSLNGRKKYCSNKCSNNAKKRLRAYNIPSRCRELATGAKHRSKIKDIPFNIDGEFILSLWKIQKGLCAVTKTPFELSYSQNLQKGWSKKDAPSLDRVEPSKGYVKGNVRLVTHQVNCAKGSFTDEDLVTMAKRIVKYAC